MEEQTYNNPKVKKKLSYKIMPKYKKVPKKISSGSVSKVLQDHKMDTKTTQEKDFLERKNTSKELNNKQLSISSRKIPQSMEKEKKYEKILLPKRKNIELGMVPSNKSEKSSSGTFCTKKYKWNNRTSQSALKYSHHKKQAMIVATCANVGYEKYTTPKTRTNEPKSKPRLENKPLLLLKKSRKIDKCYDPSFGIKPEIKLPVQVQTTEKEDKKDSLNNISSSKRKKDKIETNQITSALGKKISNTQNPKNVTIKNFAREANREQNLDAKRKRTISRADILSVGLCELQKTDELASCSHVFECTHEDKIKKPLEKKITTNETDKFNTWSKDDKCIFSMIQSRRGRINGQDICKIEVENQLKQKHKENKKKKNSKICMCHPGKFIPLQKLVPCTSKSCRKNYFEKKCKEKKKGRKRKRKRKSKLTSKTCMCKPGAFIPPQNYNPCKNQYCKKRSVIEVTCKHKAKLMKKKIKEEKKREKEIKKIKRKEKRECKRQLSQEKRNQKRKHKSPCKPKQVEITIKNKNERIESYSSEISCDELSDELFDESFDGSSDETISESIDVTVSDSDDESLSESFSPSISDSSEESSSDICKPIKGVKRSHSSVSYRSKAPRGGKERNTRKRSQIWSSDICLSSRKPVTCKGSSTSNVKRKCTCSRDKIKQDTKKTKKSKTCICCPSKIAKIKKLNKELNQKKTKTCKPNENIWFDDGQMHPEGCTCCECKKKILIEEKKESKESIKSKKKCRRRSRTKMVNTEKIKADHGTGDAEIRGTYSCRQVSASRDSIVREKRRRSPKTKTRKVGSRPTSAGRRAYTTTGRARSSDNWWKKTRRYVRNKLKKKKSRDYIKCKCRPNLTQAQELSAYQHDYRGRFRDGKRMIDLIVVVKNDGDRKADDIRMKFLVQALKTGLEFELEQGIMPVNNQLIFIKVHGPPDVLERYGEYYGVRRFYREQHIYCADKPERDFLRIVANNYPPPRYYSSLQRSLIVYKIFLHIPYGPSFKEYGINRLIALDIFRDAYALHDGPPFMVGGQEPSSASARQILFHNWADGCCCWWSMPILLIQEYMGDRVAYYFAFAQFYNRSMILLAFTSIVFLAVQGIRFALFLSQDAEESIQAFCNDTIVTGARACPECVHDKNVCLFKDMKSYCETYQYYYRLLDDGRLVYYSLFVCFWATILTYKWKIKERKLRWKFENSKEISNAELRPVHRKLPAVYRDARNRAAYYCRMFCSSLLSYTLIIGWLVMTHKFLLESEPFKKPVEDFRKLIDKGFVKIFKEDKWKEIKQNDYVTVAYMCIFSFVYALVGMVFGIICKWLAYFLVSCERHTVFALYERSLAKKLFALSAVTVFPLMVYHCFLKFIGLNLLDEPLWKPPYEVFHYQTLKLIQVPPFLARNCGPSGSCLHQISAILLGAWLVFQLVYPLIKYIFRWLFNVKDWRRRVPVWETEYLLPPMTDKMIMDRYDFLTTQFALCTLFVQTFPLLPLFCALLNQYDFRYSARLFLCSHRRPLLARFSGIGTWRNIMTVITYTTLFFHALAFAYHTVFAENLGFHNFHHEYYTEGYVPYQNPFNKDVANAAPDATDYAKFLINAFPMWRYYTIHNYTEILQNQPTTGFCLYSGQHRYNFEMTDIICGSECYNVRTLRLICFAVFLLFFALTIPFIFMLFDRGFASSQVSIAERRIQRAFYHGDLRRGGRDVRDYAYLHCPDASCYKRCVGP